MATPLFVYGTLKRGGPAGARSLLGKARIVAPASIGGTLYDLGEYPGLVRDSRNDRVRGELYELEADRADDVLRDLDRYEGRQFVRSRALVTLSNGRRRFAWVYTLRKRPKNAHRIASGVYRQRAGAAA
jgi:gamma-glutamylcyclotransferase (GGCT)/AIG2-like uncharacterized protein YtfP